MKIELPDGEKIDVESGSRIVDIAYHIGEGLGDATVGGLINGELADLREKVTEEAKVEILTLDSPRSLEIYRHTASHVMAQAVKRIFPQAKLAIGPAIDDGFYYDFDLDYSLSEEDFDQISKEMKKIIDENYKIERFSLEIEEAREYFKEEEEKYKLELLEDLEKDGSEKVTMYRQNGFKDLCQGPHLKNTGQLENFKLLEVAGAYWKGDENREMLQRVYATAFPNKSELENYLEKQKEAKERDHRKLGPELDLYSIHPDAGPGLIYWHPKGTQIRKEIEDFWHEKHRQAGYEFVTTPHIGKEELWKKSGHLDYFEENMFPSMDFENDKYYAKPMNCPFHIKIYNSKTRSYRELPLRWAELGTVYRYERSGVLHGLLRVRGFTQDDAHIICQPDQVEEEIIKTLELTFDILSAFDFKDFGISLSTRPDKYVGEPQKWEKATTALRKALEKKDLSYEVEEGEGAFYGPKIDINLIDALERSWQCTTVQFDFNLPERFDMTYMGSDGREHRPYVIHRALLGSLERFFGILIEHFKGNFPVWLSPVQAVILPVTDDNASYADQVENRLRESGIRAEAWSDVNENLSTQIRKAQLEKIPYMLVVGDREEDSDQVSLRLRTEEDLGPRDIDDFIDFALEKIDSKELL